MNRIHAHLDKEVIEINIGGNSTEFSENDYRIIALGNNTTLYMTDTQLEVFFKKLDAALHDEEETSEYMRAELLKKEDEIFDIQADLDEANETIEQLQENLQEAI